MPIHTPLNPSTLINNALLLLLGNFFICIIHIKLITQSIYALGLAYYIYWPIELRIIFFLTLKNMFLRE